MKAALLAAPPPPAPPTKKCREAGCEKPTLGYGNSCRIDSAVADGPRSVILEQVTNGLATRMAVLFLCAGVKGAAQNERSMNTDLPQPRPDAPSE